MKKVDYPKITLKFFTKKLLEHTSKSVKLKQKLIMDLVSDVLKGYPLVTAQGFTLYEDEELFEFDRVEEEKTHGNKSGNARVSADSKIVFKELSEYGKPVWLIADYGLRLVIKYEGLSGNNKWRKRIRDAIKRQSSRTNDVNGRVQWKKVQKIDRRARAPSKSEQIVEPTVLRPIARDRIDYKKDKQIQRIELDLMSMSTNEAVRFALDNFHDWYHTNIAELRRFIEKIVLNRNPVTIEVIKKQVPDFRSQNHLQNKYISPYAYGLKNISVIQVRDFYIVIGKEWSYPDWLMWFERLVSFWEDTHPYRKVRKADLTIGKWFSKYELKTPDVLHGRENWVILNYEQLKRTGIITDLDIEIKTSLGIENRIEYAYFNFDKLDKIEKTEISALVNSSDGYKYQYAQLIREKLKRDEGY